MSPEETAAFDAAHARNVRIHGAARADLARWSALLRLALYLYECERRRKDRAMLEALEALERARAAEEGEARWSRVGTWLTRRVDACEERLARRRKLVTRIDFAPAPSIADYGEGLDETIAEEDEIKW